MQHWPGFVLLGSWLHRLVVESFCGIIPAVKTQVLKDETSVDVLVLSIVLILTRTRPRPVPLHGTTTLRYLGITAVPPGSFLIRHEISETYVGSAWTHKDIFQVSSCLQVLSNLLKVRQLVVSWTSILALILPLHF